jgi:hypothetical protein
MMIVREQMATPTRLRHTTPSPAAKQRAAACCTDCPVYAGGGCGGINPRSDIC